MRTLATLTLALSLIACGGSSKKEKTTPPPPTDTTGPGTPGAVGGSAYGGAQPGGEMGGATYGGGEKLTVAQCDELMDHMVDVVSKEYPDKAAQFKQGMEQQKSDMEQQCQAQATKPIYDCMMAAQTMEALGQCGPSHE